MTSDEISELHKALPDLLERFYAAVRQDPDLGPVFEAVQDWPDHLIRLEAFWSSVMTASGRYKGHPVQAHLRHRKQIRPEMWGRWLSIWAATTQDCLPRPLAEAMQSKAARIAQSLSLALHYDPALEAPRASGQRSGSMPRMTIRGAPPGEAQACPQPSAPPFKVSTASNRPREGLANASSAHPTGRFSEPDDRSGDC